MPTLAEISERAKYKSENLSQFWRDIYSNVMPMLGIPLPTKEERDALSSRIKLGQSVMQGYPSRETDLIRSNDEKLIGLAQMIGPTTPKLPKSGKVPDLKAAVSDDYRGTHRPPMRDSGAPLYDLTGGGNVYPDDVYSSNAAQYYGHFGGNHPMDRETVNIIHGMKGKPDATVTVYRAVPYEPTVSEQLAKLNKQKYEYMRRNTVPDDFSGDKRKFYDYLQSEIYRLGKSPEQVVPKLDISKGDWVTINRNYAKDHGESTLKGKYKIISKKVKVKDIYTNGDSIHEFGYDPD